MFSRIQDLWPSKVDAFATPWNAQLPSFLSWHPQPGAMKTNAFSVNWGGLLAYCFPPFALIFKCLEKIRHEKALVVFVCPVWIGQPWFLLLLELSCDVPRLLPPSQDLLKSALDESHPLIRNGALHLAVWRLSGDNTLSKGFGNGGRPTHGRKQTQQSRHIRVRLEKMDGLVFGEAFESLVKQFRGSFRILISFALHCLSHGHVV